MHPVSLAFLQSLPPNIASNPNSKIHRNPRPPPPSVTLAGGGGSPSRVRSLCARCASSEGSGPTRAEESVKSMVEELLKREENRPLLQGLEEASRRVETAREALADIERKESLLLQLKNRESQIAESERELLEARAMVEEAQRSLSFAADGSSAGDGSSRDIDKEIERSESVRAALVSSIIGTIASVPISLYQSTSFTQLILHSITVFISCALFGVTFRYTIRRDLDNVQLKAGTSAAFGLVRGLAAAMEAGDALEPNIGSLMSHAIDGAVFVSESVFIFLSASIALDFCFKTRLLSPFPVKE